MDNTNPRRLIWPVIAALLLHLVFLGVYVSKQGRDISALVGASHAASGLPPLEAVTASIGPGGYDGMFYYAIARDPWHAHTYGLDAPAYRHGRILYSAVCWMFSFGHPRLLLWIMPLVNLGAIAGLAALGAWYALQHGMSPWWGLVLPIAVNAAIPALRNLTDAISTLAVAALLVAWFRQARPWVIVVAAAAAVFSREQNLLIVLLLLPAVFSACQFQTALGCFAVVAAWGIWACLLRALYGSWPLPGGDPVITFPGMGFAYAWTFLGGYFNSTRLAIINGLSLLHMGIVAGLAAGMACRRYRDVLGWVLLAAVGLAVLSGPVIWNDLICYRRGLAWLPLGVWLAAIQDRQTLGLAALVPAGLFSLAAALNYV